MEEQQIKASNIENATLELEGIKNGLSKSIKGEIPHKNRNVFVVAMVKITDRPGEVENDVKVDTICYDKRKFENIEKSYKSHGYTKLVVLHDPNSVSELVDETKKDETKVDPNVKTAEQIEAEIEAKAQERFEAKLAEMKSQDAGSDESIIEGFKKEVSELKSKKDLEAFAKANNIDLSGLKNKEEFKLQIDTWLASFVKE